MSRSMTRLSIVTLTLVIAATVAEAQQPGDPTGYRRFFKRPENSAEFWDAIQYELELGRFDFAARHLDNWVKQGYTKKELFEIQQKVGNTPFFQMKLIKNWYSVDSFPAEDRAKALEDPRKKKRLEAELDRINGIARQQAADLLKTVTEAVKEFRANEQRITTYVDNLTATPLERQYAFQQLYDAGALAIPTLLKIMSLRDPQAREPLLNAMVRFKPEIVPPLVAALDMNETDRRLDILFVLTNHPTFWERNAIDPVPYLWPLTTANQPSEALRKAVVKILTKFYERHEDRLPQPHEALTQEAKKYSDGTATQLKPMELALWIWNPAKGNVEQTKLSRELARKYFVTRYAKQALALKPDYRPAQMVFLSFAIDEGFELPKHGQLMPAPMGEAEKKPMGKLQGRKEPLTQPVMAQQQPPQAQPPKEQPNPIGQIKPELKTILSKLSTDLLLDLLRRGLQTNDTKLILAPVRILGERKQVEAAQAGPQGENLLVRALLYGDPRVQLAAAESLMEIPGAMTVQTREMVIEVCRRAIEAQLGSKGAPKLMVAVPDRVLRGAVVALARDLGYEPVILDSGKDVLEHVLRAHDVDLLFLDPGIKKPGFASVIAQLKNDRFAFRLPIFVPAIPNSARSETILARIREAQDEMTRIAAVQQRKDDTVNEYTAQYRVDQALNDTTDFIGNAQRARVVQLRRYLALMEFQYDKERVKRRRELQLVTTNRPNVSILDDRFVTDRFFLQDRIREALVQAKYVPLTPEEREVYAERALLLLARMAKGESAGLGQIVNRPRQMETEPTDEMRNLETVLLKAMAATNIDFESRIHAIEVVSRLPGGNVQRELFNLTFKNAKEPPEVRVAAIKHLQRHLQVFGFPPPTQYRQMVKDVTTASRNPALEPSVREAFSLLLGNLRPSNEGNGVRLLELNP